MEDALDQKGKAMVKEIAIKNLESIEELDKTANNLKVFEVLMDKIATVVKPEQAYICVHEANNFVVEVEEIMAKNWSSYRKHGIQLKSKELLESVQDLGVNETSKLAYIHKTVTNVSLPSFGVKNVKSKKVVVTKSGVYSVVPDELKNLAISQKTRPLEPTYNDIVFLANNSLLLTDSFHGTCYMFDHNLNFVGGHIEESDYDEDEYFWNPRYASYANNGMFVVSIPLEKKICLVTADKHLTFKGEISCEYEPKAVYVLSNNDLAIAWADPVAFGIMTGPMWTCKEVYFFMDKSGRILKSFDYIAVDETRCHVIQPCTIDKAVYCFDFTGQPVFKYSGAELEDPRGVALDKNQNIYICDYENCFIHILFPSGQAMQIIKEGCPESPLAIRFRRDGKKFCVTQCSHWYCISFFSVSSEEEATV